MSLITKMKQTKIDSEEEFRQLLDVFQHDLLFMLKRFKKLKKYTLEEF